MDSLGSIRTEAAPRRTITAYKLMRLVDGKLYPLYIDNSAPVELGVWYNADSPDFEILKTLPSGYCYLIDSNNRVIERTTRLLNDNQTKLRTSADVVAEIEAATAKQQRWIWIEKTNSAQRRFSGENRRYWNLGINGSGTPNYYSMRPGWHAGSLPTMLQVWCGSQSDKKTKDNFVFTECEISADIDYNPEAQRNPDKDLPDKMPVDGYYLKATNADKRAAQADRVGWYVAGAIKINRIISDSEAHAIIDRYNAQHPDDEPVQYQWPRESGKMFNADTMSLEGLDGRRYYGGNSGYQGYSKSNRAVDAEKRGLRSKSQMDNDFADKVNELIKAENPAAKKVTLAQIKKHLDNITADEWHHTSKFGNRTNYYSVERVATHFIDNIKIANATPISFVAKEDIDKILDYLQDSTCNDGKGRYLASNGVVVDVHRGEPPFSRAYNEGSVETRYISRYVEPYELDEPQRSMLVDALAEANNRRKMIVEAERTKSLFNESAAYERVRAAIVGGGLQGNEQPEPYGTKNKKVVVNGEPITIRYRGFATGEPYNVHKLRYGQSFDQDFLVFIDGKTYTAIRHWTNNGGGYTERWTYNGISVSSEKKLAELILSMQGNGLQGTKKTATALTVTVIKSLSFVTPPQTFKRRSTTTKSRLVSYTMSGISASANLRQYIDKTKLSALIDDFKIDNAEDFIEAIGKCFPQQVERERRIDEHNKQVGYEKIKKPKSKYQLIDFSEFGVKILFRVSDHNIDSNNIEDDIEEAYSLAFKSKNSPNTFKANDVTVTEYVFLTENCDRDKYRRIAQNILNFLDTSEWNEDFVKHDFKNPDDKKPLSGTEIAADVESELKRLNGYVVVPIETRRHIKSLQAERPHTAKALEIMIDYCETHTDKQFPTKVQIKDTTKNHKVAATIHWYNQAYDINITTESKGGRKIDSTEDLHKAKEIAYEAIENNYAEHREFWATMAPRRSESFIYNRDNFSEFVEYGIIFNYEDWKREQQPEQPRRSNYGLLFDETDAKWNLTAEDIALIDELQKEYSEKITVNEPERNRRNAQLAYCLIKFLKGESDAVTKNLSSSWYLTNRAYINPEYARYEYIADYLYHNPITRNIVRKYVPDLKGMSGSIKKMFEFLIELYKQQKNAKTDDANWFDAEELKRRLADDDGKTGEKLLEIAAKQAGIPTAEPEPTDDEPQNASDTYRFAEELEKLYADGEKLDLSKAKAINRQNGYNFTTNQLMQACELAVVMRATQIAQGHDRPTTLKEKYDALVDLYSRQVTIQPKDSRASSLQQYSTPAPLAFLLGCFVDNWLRPNATRNYFEPTAGNGLLTIALGHNLTTVNELDDVRFHNLQQIGYQHCYNEDICNPSKDAYMLGINKEFAGVIMNPPFGLLDKNDFLTRKATIEGREATYTFERLDHKIAILSLEKMRDDGRAAIIIGGKMAVKLGDWKESYWKNGAIFGQYRTFITYLHRQYNIVDILYINGDLYRKQGTTFPIVAILIDGRTQWNDSREHQWHKFDELRDNQIDTFNELYLRLEKYAINRDREANVANYRRLYEPKIEQPERKRAQALLMLAKAKIKIAQAQQAQRMKQ